MDIATTVVQDVKEFIEQPLPEFAGSLTAASIFSGAGLSDMGYALAGFRFVCQVERDTRRAKVGQSNFPNSYWISDDVRRCREEIVRLVRGGADSQLDMLVATPPCQGMSSSNPSRGRRQTDEATAQEEKNRLILEIIPLVKELRPRVIVAENVRPLLTLHVTYEGKHSLILEHLRCQLPDYEFFAGVVNVADYGICQDRRRALIVGVQRNESWLEALIKDGELPWPAATHSEQPTDGLMPWVRLQDWLHSMRYEPLDSCSHEAATGTHALHFVPHYSGDRYLLVSSIPPNSGASAYENSVCPTCGYSPVRSGVIRCPHGHLMRNRPYVQQGHETRLIKGFRSSYRRMDPGRPAFTITTNSSHIGSDFKIHPNENRVLSILECADLQSVPRFYDWSAAMNAAPRKKPLLYLVRNLVGEAFPPYFTFLHGKVLSHLLMGEGKGLSLVRRHTL